MLSAEYRFDSAWFTDGLVRAYYANAAIDQYTLDERAAARTPATIERDFFYDQRTRGGELNLWRDAEQAGWTHQLGLGIEYAETRTKELRNGISTSLVDGSVSTDVLGESFPVRDFPITEMRETGAYLSDELSRGPLSLIMALRYDHNELDPESDTIYADDNPATSVVALSDSDLSPKLGAILRVGDDLVTRAALDVANEAYPAAV